MIIQQKLCPPGLGNSPDKPLEGPLYITIHCTGNHSAGADAERHARYQYEGGAGSKTSWHYTVDAKSVWQSFEDTRACWHTGTARGNNASLGVEICVHDRAGFPAACANAAELTAGLLQKHKIPLDRVVQHYFWSGKDCPAELRSGAWGVSWENFLGLVADRFRADPAEAPSAGLAEPPSAGLTAAVALLRQKGVILSPAYWLENAGRLPHLPELLENMAAYARER